MRPRPFRPTLVTSSALFAAVVGAAAGLALAAEGALISKWSFEEAATAVNAVPGGPSGKVQGALAAEGRSGRALAFEDWSVKNYLKPDPKKATKVVVPHQAALNPTLPVRISAWIYPTADPIYYGGIVEKGRGFGASYRLLLLRGLKVSAAVGDGHVGVKSQAPLSLNAWHEVVLVADKESLVLTVDGKEAGRASWTAPPKLANTDPVVIGDRFTGRIDEVSIGAP